MTKDGLGGGCSNVGLNSALQSSSKATMQIVEATNLAKLSASAYLSAIPVGSRMVACTLCIIEVFSGASNNFFSVKGETSDGKIVIIKSWGTSASPKLQEARKDHAVSFEGLYCAPIHQTSASYTNFDIELHFKPSSDMESLGLYKQKLPRKLQSFAAIKDNMFCELQCEMLGRFRNSMLGTKFDSCGVAVLDMEGKRAELFVKSLKADQIEIPANSFLVVQATVKIEGELVSLIANSAKDVTIASVTPKKRYSLGSDVYESPVKKIKKTL